MPRIGKLTIDAPFFQAGLAGYSDAAMRLVARRHGAPYAVTEAMLDMFLINGGRGLKAAELREADHPIAGQLMGSHPTEIAQAAKVLVSLGYDVIDVNLACPVKKIRKRARGGHLLQVPDEAAAILDAVRQAVPAEIPCTVKLRRGSDDTPEAEANFHRIFQAVLRLGYAGATVHGRTVEQKYRGPSRWAFLANLVREYGLGVREDESRVQSPESRVEYKEDATASLHDSGLWTLDSGLNPPFSIFGSGDIWCAQDIFRMIKQTGVHGVSVARGCIGNPWVFTQARALMADDHEGGARAPTIYQQRGVLLDHFHLSVELHGEKMASMMMRKFGIKFARHHPTGDDVARQFIAARSLAEWQAVIDAFYSTDGPGVVRPALNETPADVGDAEETCEDPAATVA